MKSAKIVFALLAALMCSIGAAAEKKSSPLTLYQIFTDSAQKLPRRGEPYFIYLDGKLVDTGITDGQGAVITHHRIDHTDQEFVMRLFRFGTYSFRFDKNNNKEVDQVTGWRFSEDWEKSCDPKASDCVGNGFYWIQLIGKGTDFKDEPYSLTMGTRNYKGKVAENGYIFVQQDNPPAVSEPIMLRLCAGPEISLSIGTDRWHSSATPLKLPSSPLTECKNSSLANYIASNAALNHGMPYLYSLWSKGESPTEIAEKEQADERHKLDEYHRLAVANSDALAWLGAPPVNWSDDEYKARKRALTKRIQADVNSLSKDDVKRFECKAPEAIGATPDMAAVNAYLENFPDSASDKKLLTALYAAAAKGNWLAVAQIFGAMSQQDPVGNAYFYRYRLLQLEEWLQQRKIGALYDLYGYQLAATGYYSDMSNDGPTAFSIYAALHGSYPAQFEVGDKLKNEGDNAELQAVGIAMQQCAKTAVPAYAKQLE